MRPNSLLLRTDEAARVARVHRTTVLRWIQTGELRAIRVGASWRIPEAALSCDQAQVRDKVLAQLRDVLPEAPYLTPREVRLVLRCSAQELARVIPPLPCVGVAASTRFERVALLEWIGAALDQQPQEAADEV